jgi:large subunit ribosomal protein L19
MTEALQGERQGLSTTTLPDSANSLHSAAFGRNLTGDSMNIIKKIEQEHLRMDLPRFKSGDTIKVHMRIVEGEKERVQIFQGNVIRLRRGTTDSTFTVRKISGGVGVERVFPLHSPFIESIEVVQEGRVRRSRLFYLRNLKGKAARIKPKNRY